MLIQRVSGQRLAKTSPRLSNLADIFLDALYPILFFCTDTIPPVLTLALEIGSARVSQQLLADQPSVFLAWNSTEPVPGLLVVSEPCPSVGPPAFSVTGGILQNLQFDPDIRGTTGQNAYTFQVRNRLKKKGLLARLEKVSQLCG